MTKVELLEYLQQHRCVWEILNKVSALDLANWFVGAGAICQTVWNIKHHNEPGMFIKDIDLIYFDSSDPSASAEQEVRARVRRLLGHVSLPIDVTNQARVHQWYAEEFGFDIEPYCSAEDAIESWPTTASAIGVRRNSDGEFDIYAPFGLEDIEKMIVQPNRKQVTKSIYESKALRWKKLWPKLKIVPW